MGGEKKSLSDLFKNLDYDKPIKEVSDAVQVRSFLFTLLCGIILIFAENRNFIN